MNKVIRKDRLRQLNWYDDWHLTAECPVPHQKTIHPNFPWASPVSAPSCLQHVEHEVVNESCFCISLHGFAVNPVNRVRTDV